MAVREGKSGLRGISRRTRGREGIRRGKWVHWREWKGENRIYIGEKN